MIHKANISDIKEIHSLLLRYAEQGILLGRSLSELYDQIRDFYVFIDPNAETLAGICGLHICWDDLAEIRSLAVKEEFKGQGTGLKLVKKCIQEARDFGIHNVFVLTYVPNFFSKLGFQSVDKSILPHKVWADCINCIKFPDCDEEAMMLKL